MRHKNKNKTLGRRSAHRNAMLSNMATSLIMHKRIFTTVPKAKTLRKYVEPLITQSKEDSTHSRRIVFSKLQNKYAVTELFQTVSPKVADRPGGYTRILKTGYRLGDNAPMCFIELVDFNENMLGDAGSRKTKTRRSRRRGASKAAGTATVGAAAIKDESKKSKSVAESEVKPEVVEPVADVTEKVELAKAEIKDAGVADLAELTEATEKVAEAAEEVVEVDEEAVDKVIEAEVAEADSDVEVEETETKAEEDKLADDQSDTASE